MIDTWVTDAEVESATRKLPVSFRFTFYVFFFPLLRSDKTCNFHQLQLVVYERGYKFKSAEEKQATGRISATQEGRQLSLPPSVLGTKRQFGAKSKTLELDFFLVLKTILFPLCCLTH